MTPRSDNSHYGYRFLANIYTLKQQIGDMNGHRRVKTHAEKRILVLIWALGFTSSAAICNGLDERLSSIMIYIYPDILRGGASQYPPTGTAQECLNRSGGY